MTVTQQVMSNRALPGSHDWSVAALTLVIKGLIFGFGVVSYLSLANRWIGGGLGWLEIWNHWDATHYLGLAQYGYQTTGEMRVRLAFYPLFPWLTRLVALVIGNYLVSTFIVSGLASLAAAMLFQRLVQLDYAPLLAWRAVWFLLIFPTSYFLHIGYTESLFLALTLGCFLAARCNRWLLAGTLAALAGLTRINGLILIPALLIEALQQYRHVRRWHWRWLWISLAVLGVGGYLVLNAYVAGDAFMFLTHQQEYWHKSLGWPWIGIGNAINALGRQSTVHVEMTIVLELVFIGLGLICTIASWLMLRPAYGMWMLGNWLLITSTSWITCTPRYTLLMFPIYILFAKLAAGRLGYAAITTWSLLFLALFVSWFAQGRWAF